MVKADVKHNYYADLELPSTCTIDDIKKQYRKLALQYHPDRNAGKEDEYVPKFQAIQTAHEILGDPGTKQKYDADRRKVGAYPGTTFRASQPAPGNPYSANTAYPPPPRRTQPGKWQRPQPYAAQASNPSPSTGAAGADRFSNFPRGSAPTARKDPMQDRSNIFHAWQNMNNTQERQQRFNPSASAGPQTSPTAGGRPQPPPRNPTHTRMPTEEEIRAGMNHKKAPSGYYPERPDSKQSAWAAFNQSNAGKPGVKSQSRTASTKTPKRQGFDPNVPGSDERPAGTGNYVPRNKSADFGRSYPPPPPGPPPRSPLSPTDGRPVGDPLRPFKSRGSDHSDAPYTESERLRTPYRTMSGEKTAFSSEGLHRSASTRDTTKLNRDGNTGRARSTSPPRNKANGGKQGGGKTPFIHIDYSSSEESSDDPDTTHTSEEFEDHVAGKHTGSGAVPPSNPADRPKKHPTAPSRRFNGSQNPSNTPPPSAAAQSDGEQRKSSKPNMYAAPTSSFPHISQQAMPSAAEWTMKMFGIDSTQRQIPAWAIPSSIPPGGTRKSAARTPAPSSSEVLRGAQRTLLGATSQESDAYRCFRSEIESSQGSVPEDLDMDVFLKLAWMLRHDRSSGNESIDFMMARTLSIFTLVGVLPPQVYDANPESSDHSFSFPMANDMFTPNAKSRSEENINTNFSPEPWNGTFTGSGTTDYFPQQASKARAPSPTRSSSQTGGNGASMPPPPAPVQSDGSGAQSASGEARFSPQQWQEKFSDASWTWPPPPPNPPTGIKGKTPRKKSSRSSAKSSRQTQAADDEEDYEPQAQNDAMDIDPTPASQPSNKEAKIYPVPPSTWHQQQHQQQQAQAQAHSRRASKASVQPTGDAKFAANLDDLAHVEPIARSANGLKNLADLSATLPFQSQPSSSAPQHHEPRRLAMPPVPKPPETPVKLTLASWREYTGKFGLYVQAFHVHNHRMLQHFGARDQEAQVRMASGMGWLEAAGDTSGLGGSGVTGFGGYMQTLKEDAQVRETWMVASERHLEACERFEKVRERVKELVETGKLVAQ